MYHLLDDEFSFASKDVPFGTGLSAGIDSSAIVCGMRYLEPDMPIINTFSYIAPESTLSEKSGLT